MKVKIILITFCILASALLYSIEEIKILASDGSAYDWFGFSVFISGDNAIIGSPMDDGESGSAYIFEQEGSQWLEHTKLIASDGSYSDNFGWSVSISGDYAIVGAECDTDNGIYNGSAYIFKQEENQWIEQTKLTASDGDNYYVFGHSVWINDSYAFIGAPGASYENNDHVGAVYIFKLEGSNWIEYEKLVASDCGFSDEFGTSISVFGDYIIVGSPDNDGNDLWSGAAYIFKKEGNNWVEQVKLIASDGATADHFGCSVSIFGNYAIVGAEWNDENGDQSGSVYIFERVGESWIEYEKLIASYTTSEYTFGRDVSINGDYLVVGSDTYDTNGLASIFELQDSTWVEQVTFYDRGGHYGNSVSMCEDKMIIGAFMDDENGDYSGSAYIYDISDLTTINENEVPNIDCCLTNYPNPLNPTTTISFSIPNESKVDLSIFNIKGQEVKQLISYIRQLPEGQHSVIWDGRDDNNKPVSSGIYFYKLIAGDHQKVRKLILLK